MHQWRTVHRPALLRVAGAVDGLGQSALNNAHDQRGVSQGSAGAATGLNPGSGSAGGIDDALHALGEHTGAVAWAGLLVGLGSNANLTGRYSRDAIAIRTALSNLSCGRATLDDLRYKKWLNGPFTTNGILDTVHKSPAWKGLKGGMSALGTALTIERLVSPSSDWWTRGHATVDLAADQMKTSAPKLSVNGTKPSSTRSSSCMVDGTVSGEHLGRGRPKDRLVDVWSPADGLLHSLQPDGSRRGVR